MHKSPDLRKGAQLLDQDQRQLPCGLAPVVVTLGNDGLIARS